jgi:hypothetical protein
LFTVIIMWECSNISRVETWRGGVWGLSPTPEGYWAPRWPSHIITLDFTEATFLVIFVPFTFQKEEQLRNILCKLIQTFDKLSKISKKKSWKPTKNLKIFHPHCKSFSVHHIINSHLYRHVINILRDNILIPSATNVTTK